jgi:hypothetical protein
VSENKEASAEEKNPESKKRINIITIFAVESNSLKTSFISIYICNLPDYSRKRQIFYEFCKTVSNQQLCHTGAGRYPVLSIIS